MTFPVVSAEICESIKGQLENDKNYVNRLLDEIQLDNPELGDFILSSATQLANRADDEFALDEDCVNFIRNNTCWLMIAVYNSIKQQAVCDSI